MRRSLVRSVLFTAKNHYGARRGKEILGQMWPQIMNVSMFSDRKLVVVRTSGLLYSIIPSRRRGSHEEAGKAGGTGGGGD